MTQIFNMSLLYINIYTQFNELGGSVPFRVGVHFDGDEAAGSRAELGPDDTSVVGDAGRGDVGFSIGYVQNACQTTFGFCYSRQVD